MLRILPATVAFMLALFAIGDAHALRLATWNLDQLADTNDEGCRPRTDAHYDLLKEYAERLNADIVAVQEVENKQALERIFDPDQWNVEISSRPTQVPIRECEDTRGNYNITWRTGFAIRKPIRYTRNPDLAALDVGDGNSHRYAVDITVEAGVPLRLLAIHLNSGCKFYPVSSENRDCLILFQQQKVLKDWVIERSADGVPFAIVGDFNRPLQNVGDFWRHLDEPAHPRQKLSLTVSRDTEARCLGRYDRFTDFIVLNAQAEKLFAPASFRELRYDGEEESFPSDKCPVSVELKIYDLKDTSPQEKTITTALKWYRRSAEFRLISKYIFTQAMRRVDEISEAQGDADNWVVSLDADETLFDNSSYRLERDYLGLGFEPARWTRWQERGAAKALPGAIAFMNHVIDSGGKITVITKRDSKFNQATRDNLIRLGLRENSSKVCILGRAKIDKEEANPKACGGEGYGNDKDRRRRLVREGSAADCWDGDGTAKASWNKLHRFVLWVGDSVHDLPCINQPGARAEGTHPLKIGKDYFLLPNPLYGPWLKSPP